MISKGDFIVIHDLYAKGHSIREIARLMKLNQRTVRRKLQELEYQPPAKRKTSRGSNHSWSYPAIYHKFDSSRVSIHH